MSRDSIKTVVARTGTDQSFEAVTGTDVGEKRALDVNVIQTSGGSGTTTTEIFNIPLGAINTEQSQDLPANTKGFILKSRGAAKLKLTYIANESGTKFISIPSTGVYTDNNFYTAQTIYFQSPQTSDTIEIVTYT